MAVNYLLPEGLQTSGYLSVYTDINSEDGIQEKGCKEPAKRKSLRFNGLTAS